MAVFYLAKIVLDSVGVMTHQWSRVADSLMYGATGYYPTMFGANETSRILTNSWSAGAYRYGILDTDSMTHIPVTGIYPNDEGWSDFPAFTSGNSFLVYHYLSDEWGWDIARLQRYTISSSGVATAVGPLMTFPQISIEGNDGYYLPTARDVWDDGDYTAVAVMREFTTGPGNRDYESQLHLAIFDNIHALPLHVLLLATDPSEYMWSSDPTTITFAKVGNSYEVTYTRISKRPVADSAKSFFWLTYVRRSVDPVTGVLGPEIFVGDVDDDGGLNDTPYVRADSGATLAYLERYGSQGSYYKSKVQTIGGAPNNPVEGGRTVIDWRGYSDSPGYAWGYAWIGIQESAGGPLHFKYRWPG